MWHEITLKGFLVCRKRLKVLNKRFMGGAACMLWLVRCTFVVRYSAVCARQFFSGKLLLDRLDCWQS
ncbi:hypothetical protein BDR05DRAFT_371603 [Suillus weaverae]|nr:hypothetical protein BDR05DRAFT_371603 [Suillus weaverae]